MTLEQLTEFFGWLTVINIGFLTVTTVLLTVFMPYITDIHSKVFNIAKEALPPIYLKYLAIYKILMFIFILTPYIALKIMVN